MTKDEALRMALDVLQTNYGYSRKTIEALTAIKELLAQPEQEPNGYVQTVIEALYENGDPVSVDAAELLQRITAQPEQERELAFAGVKVWVGNQWVLRGATREDLHHADDPWTILRLHSEVCIATLKERNQ